MNPGEIDHRNHAVHAPKLPRRMRDPNSPRTGGKEYVWHCHILEHEEHDMMRPLVVRSDLAANKLSVARAPSGWTVRSGSTSFN